jgi:hypothetical protein
MSALREGFSRANAAVLLAAMAAINLLYAAVLVWTAYASPAAGQSRPIPDFVAFWAAGRMTLDGDPGGAYDWARHRAVEVAGLGFDFTGLMPWHYPPPFQLAVTPFASLPVWTAMALWVGLSGALYLYTCWRILPGWVTVAGALAAAPTAMIIVNGQTGFLLAGLLGLALLGLDRRPLRAGVLLGLLAIKPHLVAAIPLPLFAAGRWRVIAAGAATVAAMVLASLALLGPGSWSAFIHSVRYSGEVFQGAHGRFIMYASPYGAARLAGAGFPTALALQAGVALATLAALVAAFRSPALAPALKAALICFGTAAIAPRILNYDLHILMIGGLFQVRHGLARGFFPGEQVVLAAAFLGAFVSMLFPPGIAWALAGALFWACWLGHCRRPATARV